MLANFPLSSFTLSQFTLPSKSSQKIIFFNLEKENLKQFLIFLKNNQYFQAKLLMDIWAIDFSSNESRYEVIYCLVSPRFNLRILVKVRSLDPIFPSVVELFSSANWLEREVWDMHGIFFSHHPDLRRILTDYGFEGYPLLKDFPLSGYTEIRYDQEIKTCIQEPILANQEFRSFDFVSPWALNYHA